jgi:mannobiose 2-epimerase
MKYYTERLNTELQNILNFWFKYSTRVSKIIPEISNEGNANTNAVLGSYFVSGILYGSSAAVKQLRNYTYMPLCELAYYTLTRKMRNPKGGYIWGINPDGTILHDELNVSMVQAFILYGLAEYYALTGDEAVANQIAEQIEFIENKLKKKNDGSYADGFTFGWNDADKQYRSLSTHLHILGAYTKVKKATRSSQYDKYIENLIRIVLKYFINLKVTRVIHKFESNWFALPDENLIGDNVEASWILCDAARTLKNAELFEQCKDVALKLCNSAIELGFDSQYGGMFNRFHKGVLLSTNKEYSTQAESVLAFINAHSLTGDKKYLSYAIRILEYIDNTFSDPVKGEWYETVSREGKPYLNKPKVHLWKTMHHNVRYCINTVKNLENLFVPVLKD